MKKFNNEVMLGAFIVGAGGLLAYMCIAVGGLNMTSGVHVTAKFANASGLVKDAAIAVAGVEVGHIESLAVDHDKAVVGLFLRKDSHIRSDVKAVIRAKSLLGEKYLELRPQSTTAPELKNGDVVNDTIASVEVDELLASLGPVLKQVDPKDVATIVHVAAKTLNDEQGSLAATIHNAAQISSDVNDLIARNKRNVNQISDNVASIAAQGNQFITAKRPALERTVAQVDHLTGVLNAEAPSLTRKAQRIASTVDEMTTTINQKAPSLIKNADQAMTKLPGALDQLDGLSKGVKTTLDKTNPLLDKANSMDEAKLRTLTENVLLKTGVKIYMAPFGPSSAEEWKKQPQTPPAPPAADQK
jgi:phospholipid/cholesterol/gamma-HCH transport system substrate-binding protein